MTATPDKREPPTQWKPAQCGNGRHYYNTDGKKIIGDTCRCGKKPIKRMA